MRTDDLYGFKDDDLDDVRKRIESTLGIVLQLAISPYRGTYYATEIIDQELIILQYNRDPIDGELMEEHYPDLPVLLYIYTSERVVQIEHMLITQTNAQLLRRHELF